MRFLDCINYLHRSCIDSCHRGMWHRTSPLDEHSTIDGCRHQRMQQVTVQVAVHKALPSYFHIWKMFLHHSILNSKSDFLNCIYSSGMRIISFVKEIMKQSHKATNISCMCLNIILIYWSFWYLHSKIVTWIHQLSYKHTMYIQRRSG